MFTVLAFLFKLAMTRPGAIVTGIIALVFVVPVFVDKDVLVNLLGTGFVIAMILMLRRGMINGRYRHGSNRPD